MPLKLNAFSGGSVTLNPASTASDFTLTLPAVSGTVVHADTSGRVGIGTGAPGARLNVQQTGTGSETSLLISRTTVNVNDEQNITWRANDLAVDYAAIGGIATGATAGALSFKTISAGTTPTERARITSIGDFQFNSGYGSVATAFGCRAWVNFDASTGTPVIRGSGNVSSLTDFGAGQFGINFTTSMPDTNYCVHISHSHNSTATGFNIVGAVVISAAQARVGTWSGTAFADYAFNYVSVFR